jgi:hypothetical protein
MEKFFVGSVEALAIAGMRVSVCGLFSLEFRGIRWGVSFGVF